MRSAGVEFRAISALQLRNLTRVFDCGALHSKANAEERNLLLARVGDGVDHSSDPALAESARNENAINVAKQTFGSSRRIDVFGFYPFDHYALAIGEASVYESFAKTFVSILQLNIFSDHADAHFALRMLQRFQ